MDRSVCAYCKQPAVLTREHLWPASLHRRRVEAGDPSARNVFWLRRLEREIPNEPRIGDVCAQCNNGVLSRLDAYICSLFDSTLVHVARRDERVKLEYDYHLLKRWLLKLCYNSARMHRANDVFAFQEVLPYIRGLNDGAGRSVHLYVQMSYPQEVPLSDLEEGTDVEPPVIYEPTSHRVGQLVFRAGNGQKVLRAVHLRSFSFYLAFFRPDERRRVMDHFDHTFTSSFPGTTRLRPSRPAVDLCCNGMGAWDSFRLARENRIVFGDPSAGSTGDPEPA